MLNYWGRNSDHLIIGKVFGAQSLGIYARAYKLLGLALGVMTSLFGKVLLPSLKDLGDKGGDMNKEYMNILGIISLLSFPASIILIFFAEPLVRILWSDTWIEVAKLLPYIGILILTQTLDSTTGNIFILYKKENTLMKIGIPTNMVIIAAIALGSFFSVIHVLRFYAIVSIVFDKPFVLYYGFKKSFGISTKVILDFWIPKLVLSILMIVSVWLDYKWLTAGLLTLYFVHLVINQKEDIVKTFNFVLKKVLFKSGNKNGFTGHSQSF
jgi:PST family polysaccharide transporter